ncbi:MAG: hypothetical protein J6N18_10725 [Kiritimatiellae bacterium]|nr:hypothetical protein [Kiritimatiellia bacterium]
MNVLLKIVQGPNAGAEIAVAEGMTVSLGKGDSCDILLADQSLADVACELEVSAERVRMLRPGGVEERLEPFVVKFLGETTAIAIGPETGAWGELVWPVRGSVATETESSSAAELNETAESAEESTQENKEKGKRHFGCGCIVALALLVPVSFVALAFLMWPFRSSVAKLLGSTAPHLRPVVYFVHDAGIGAVGFAWDLAKGCIPEGVGDESVPPPPSIRDVAAAHGLLCVETNGTCVLSGNFATRMQRLSATAAAYAAKPGVTLDVSDDESLRHAASEILELVSEGKLKVHSATNRIIELSGFSPGASNLRATLEAIRADVPNVRNVDCTRVTLGESNVISEVVEPANPEASKPAVKGVKTARVHRDKRKSPAPKMPVVGVMTVPYPCIVLKDGSRVTEGAEFGGFVIDRIGADTIRVRGPEGTFEWRP